MSSCWLHMNLDAQARHWKQCAVRCAVQSTNTIAKRELNCSCTSTHTSTHNPFCGRHLQRTRETDRETERVGIEKAMLKSPKFAKKLPGY